MAQGVVEEEDVAQREESTYDLESEDTDAITLNDTEDSQYDEDASWPLDYILAEADTDESDTDGNTTRVRKYLVKWTGYSKAKATWQKRADFVGDAETVFFAWQENRMREVRGHRDEFDLGAYQRYLDAIEHAKERRHEKRNKKRKKLKLDQVNYDAEDDADDEEESTDDRGTAQAARGHATLSSESGPIELDDSSDDGVFNSDKPTARVGALRVRDEPAPYKGTMRPPTSRGRMPFAHSPSSAGSPVSTRRPSVDSSRKHTQHEPPLKRRRRTNSEIERDEEQTKALQRKKGIAVSKKSGTNTSAPTTRLVSSTPKTKTLTKPTVPKANSFFANLQKPASKTATSKPAPEATTTIPAAPVARMVGGPKQSKPKPVAQAAGSRPATNIFAPVPKKQRKVSEPLAKFKSLSHQHAVFKKMREEPTPSMDQLQLISLQTGLPIARTTIVKEAATASSMNEPAILPTTTPASSAAINQPGPEPTKLAAKQALEEENDAFKAMRISTPANIEASATSMLDTNENELGKLFTCYHWATRGSCNHGRDCYLEHYHTGEVAPPDNKILPSQITCWFWFYASCSKSAEKCKFVHGLTRYMSQKNRPPIRLRQDNVKDVEELDGPPTCWFWFFNDPPCRMSDKICAHVHEEMSFVAPHPKDIARGVGKLIPYQDALHLRNKSLRPDRRTLESAELGDIHSPVEEPRSPPPRARLGREDDDNEPIRTIINLLFQQKAALAPSEFKIRGRATRDTMHAMPATLRMKQLHDQVKEFGVLLEFADEATKPTFLERAGAASQGPPLALDISLCIAEMMRQYMDLNKQEIYASGQIVSEDIDDSEIERLFQTLRSHSGGCMVLDSEFSMLIFPTGQQSWDFLRLPKAGPGVKLQFVVMPPIQPLPETKGPPQTTDAAQLERELSSEIVLDHDRLFHANSRERSVFLLFHSNYAEKIEAMMTSLHKAGATVYLNSEAGSWVQFTTKCDSGTVIVHPSFDDFHRIPNLAAIVNKPSFRFFSFGEASLNNTLPTFDLNNKPFVRLFPHGKAVFIMDRVLADQPQMAYAVVKELHPRLREAPTANCVLGRPDLLRWLQKLALEEPDEPHSETYALLATLLHSSPINLTTWPMPERPTSQSPVYFEPGFENPEYDARYEQSKEEAEEEMAEWFALWALRNVQRYKSFVIVSLANNKTMKNWVQKWGHVEVLNPLTFVAQLSKAEMRKREHEDRQKREKEKAREKEREREKEKEKEKTTT